jgi:hypothetical protein
MANNKKKIFWIIFTIFLLSRILYLFGNYLWYDEAGWGADLKDFNSFVHNPTSIPHLPLGLMVYKVSSLIFGLNDFAIRIVPIVFGIFSFLLIYSFARKHSDERTALIAISIYTLMFWPYLSNVQIDMDGSILQFLVLCAVYMFMFKPFYHSNLYIGIVLCLISYARLITGPIILFCFGLYTLYLFYQDYRNYKEKFVIIRHIKHRILELVQIFIAYVGFFIPLLSITWFYNKELVVTVIEQTFFYGAKGYNLNLILISIYAIFIFLLSFAIIFFDEKIYRKKNALFFIIISVYSFLVLGKTFDPARYLMILIPFVVLMAAEFVNKHIDEINTIRFIAMSIAFTICYLSWSYVPIIYTENFNQFINTLSINSSFLVSGSSMKPVFIALQVFVFTYLAVAIGFLLIKFKVWQQKYMAYIIALILAFNVFMILSFAHTTGQPDVAKIGKEMVLVCKQKCNLSYPFLSDSMNYESLEFYFNQTSVERIPYLNAYTKSFNYSHYKINRTTNVFLINNFNNTKKVQKMFSYCKILYDNGIGLLMECYPDK